MKFATVMPQSNSEKEFLSHCRHYRYSAKNTILHAGDESDSLYYVVRGSISVVVIEDGGDGKEIILAYLGPGDFFGEMGLFGQDNRSAWIRAKSDCEVAEINYEKFISLSSKHPAFLFTISQQIAQRLCNTTRKVGDLTFLDVTGRVARALLDLSKLPDAMTHPKGMQIKITRQEIGRIVGCSREMVGRVLKDLEEEGLVTVRGKIMIIYGAR